MASETPINVTLTLDDMERSVMNRDSQAWFAFREHRVQVEAAVRSAVAAALAAERARVAPVMEQCAALDELTARMGMVYQSELLDAVSNVLAAYRKLNATLNAEVSRGE